MPQNTYTFYKFGDLVGVSGIRHFREIAAVTFIFLFLGSRSSAQSDSTHYDLGRVTIHKDHVQRTVIQGTDLQRYYTQTTQEAILTRIGHAHDITYVVDGLAINDINAYSIYDIEEVVLIDNALSAVNGALGNGVVALVRTNRNTRNGVAIQAASKIGSSGYRKGEQDAPYSLLSEDSKLYQQHYVGGRIGKDRWAAGASVDFLRQQTLEPNLQVMEHKGAFSQLRTRLFGVYDLHRNHTLSAEVQWSPDGQADNYQLTPGYYNYFVNHDDRDFSNLQSVMQLKSRFSSRFRNALSLAFNWYESGSKTVTESDTDVNETFTQNQVNRFGRSLLVRDRLSYVIGSVGRVLVTPSLNLTYRKLRARNRSDTYYEYGYFQNGQWIRQEQATGWQTSMDESLFNVAPAIDFQYRDIVNITGGTVFELTDFPREGAKRIFPFLSGSFDLLRAVSKASSGSIKLHSSYAQNPFLADVPLFQWFSVSNLSGVVDVPTYLDINDKDVRYDHFQLGMQADIPKVKLTPRYTFGRLNHRRRVVYGDYYPYPIPWDNYIIGPYPIVYDVRSVYHRFGLGRVFSGTGWQWRSDLLFTHRKDQREYTYASGGVDDGKYAWWQWSNGFDYKWFFAAVDLMHQSNPDYTPNSDDIDKYTLTLQHAYVGFKLPLSAGARLEVYGYGRNLLENTTYYRTRYYGAGLRFAGW